MFILLYYTYVWYSIQSYLLRDKMMQFYFFYLYVYLFLTHYVNLCFLIAVFSNNWYVVLSLSFYEPFFFYFLHLFFFIILFVFLWIIWTFFLNSILAYFSVFEVITLLRFISGSSRYYIYISVLVQPAGINVLPLWVKCGNLTFIF